MSLAIAEKKPQRRPGGFVGIFFQLLDWNRRLARKKLLSRKLLPPVRAPSKKFSADDKMPLAKLLLIDDDNMGGFPSAKRPDADVDLGLGMRAPGLVAKLMGLETMPVVAHERPRKATDSVCRRSNDECGREPHRIDQDLCVQDGGIGKLESRPQKLQKTGGFLERQQLDVGRSKLGVTGKKVLSSPSKDKKHQKLASPVKSPRLPSAAGHRTRLMKAATKILEPGLQSRSRAKSAITYMDSSLFVGRGSSDTLKIPNEPFCNPVLESSISCDSLGGTSRIERCQEEHLRPMIDSSALGMSNAPCSRTGLMENSSMALGMQVEQSRNRKTSMPAQAKRVMQNKAKELGEKKYNQNANKTRPDGSPAILQRNHFSQNQSTLIRDKVAFGSKVSSRKHGGRDANQFSGSKGCIFIDGNAGNYNHVKSACEKKTSHGRALGDNSLAKNMPRKRTISSFGIENVDAFHSSCTMQSVGSNLSNQKGIGRTSNRSAYKKCITSESKNDTGGDFSFRASDIVSFTFNSPIRCASRSSSYEEVEEKSRTKKECVCNVGSDKILVLDAKCKNLKANRTALRGDELSKLLEQKIRELTSMKQDSLVARHAWSASSILEDLGPACISEQNDYNHAGGSSKRVVMSCSTDISDIATPQSKEAKFSPAPALLAIDNDQLSPISILEASFSSETCSFGSLNATAGGKLQFNLAESCNTTQSTDLDTDLLDSANSVDIRRSIVDENQHLIYISSSYININCDEVGFSTAKLCEARHAISNAVMLFENFALYGSGGSVDLSLESFLLDMLQAIVNALHQCPKSDPSYSAVKETAHFRELLFDCMVECLDTKYICLCKFGYMTFFQLPFLLTREQLIREVHAEIKGWVDLRGKFLDDLIKNEMESSTGKWTDCKIEAFEAGMTIEGNILQTLVEEMVVDFC